MARQIVRFLFNYGSDKLSCGVPEVGPAVVTCGDRRSPLPGTIMVVSLRLLYLIVLQLLSWLTLLRPTGSRGDGVSLQVEARTYK
jgi:hypothetical protein